MLELKNITKIYKTKQQEVTALDDVNLYFEQTGMVFITGKSGSGKTTLLNVIGGLDDFTSGEIIIKGKSVTNFSGADYDNYRNTYIGFVFQEFNLLDNLTIEKNINLAMKLQGKQASLTEVNEILKKVDLHDVAQRRPQQLSGGQRQRVAIARALIKNPSIIMADEPTGALDTESGLQVMDLLKELSKEKLVIVVSHDIELADKYADRIIHITDGKIDSDLTVTTTSAGGAVRDDAESLGIKRGAELADEDLKKIKSAVKQRKNIYVADNINVVKQPTVVNKQKYDGSSSFLKARLGLEDTIKIGLGTLKSKKIRLAITVILCVFAFTVFGVFDSLSIYNETSMVENALKYSQTPSITISASAKEENNVSYDINAGQRLIDRLEQETNYDVKGVYDLYYIGTNSPLEMGANNAFQISKYYYYKSLRGAIEFDNEDLTAYKFSMDYGRLPEAFDEIAISQYYALCMVNWSYNYKDANGDTVIVKDVDEIVNDKNPLYLTVGTADSKFSYKIVGIVNTGRIDKKFDKMMGDFDKCSAADQNEFFNYVNNSLNLYAFVKPGFSKYALAKYNTLTQYGNKAYNYQIAIKTMWNVEQRPLIISTRNNFYRFEELTALTDNYFFIDENKTSLEQNEILVDVSQFDTLYSDLVGMLLEAASSDKQFNNDIENIILSLNATKDAKTTAEEKLTNLKSAIENLTLVQDAIDNVEEVTRLESVFYRYYTMCMYDTSVYEQGTNNPVSMPLDNVYYKIVGFFSGVSIPKVGVTSMVMTDESLESLNIRLEQGEYSYMVATNLGNGKSNTMGKLLLDEDDIIFTCRNNAISLIKMNSMYFDKIADLFWIVSSIFAAFSVAMFANFIASSIKGKYAEIGILRALGARGKDILNMFLVETIAVAIINAVFACLLAWGGGYLVNMYLAKFLNFYIPIATFGARQILIITAMSLFVGMASASIPIALVSRQKPVETIRRAM